MDKKIYRLIPTSHDNLWGGRRLFDYGKVSASPIIAESWELSAVPGSEAAVDFGAGRVRFSEAFPRELWGRACRDFPFFPVLTKFIDAREKLSVQVHPSDEYALKNEGQYGKSEMWYIVDAEPGAGIYMGLTKECTAEEFSRAVSDGTVERLLAFHEVKPGEVYFIPAGTVHAICGGVLIYEIQENSTLTYRLYDYMRRDKNGNLRELHVEKAMRVASLKPYTPPVISGGDSTLIGLCDYFEVHHYALRGDGIRLTAGEDSYLALTAVSGTGEIAAGDERQSVTSGDSFFIPAGAGEISIGGTLGIITIKTPGKICGAAR